MKKKALLIGSFISLLMIGFSVSVWAARTVQITVAPGDSLQLSNPSDVTVNYDLECFDASGASIANLTGQTLASKATQVMGGAGNTCAVGAVPVASSSNSTGLVRCQQASTTFTNAASRCDAFYSLCTFDQVQATGTINDNGFWFNIDTASWDFSTDGASTFSAAPAGDQAASSSSGSNYCRRSGVSRIFCQKAAPATSLNGTLCCPGSNGNLCSVSVLNSDGYLSSPQFKGGAPF